jgi:hypothetical protein
MASRVNRRGRVHVESWAGRGTIPVLVLEATPKRYRVRWLESKLGKTEGARALVPRYAVTFDQEEARDA